MTGSEIVVFYFILILVIVMISVPAISMFYKLRDLEENYFDCDELKDYIKEYKFPKGTYFERCVK